MRRCLKGIVSRCAGGLSEPTLYTHQISVRTSGHTQEEEEGQGVEVKQNKATCLTRGRVSQVTEVMSSGVTKSRIRHHVHRVSTSHG